MIKIVINNEYVYKYCDAKGLSEDVKSKEFSEHLASESAFMPKFRNYLSQKENLTPLLKLLPEYYECTKEDLAIYQAPLVKMERFDAAPLLSGTDLKDMGMSAEQFQASVENLTKLLRHLLSFGYLYTDLYLGTKDNPGNVLYSKNSSGKTIFQLVDFTGMFCLRDNSPSGQFTNLNAGHIKTFINRCQGNFIGLNEEEPLPLGDLDDSLLCQEMILFLLELIQSKSLEAYKVNPSSAKLQAKIVFELQEYFNHLTFENPNMKTAATGLFLGNIRFLINRAAK